MTDKISVIIPAYNCQKTIENTIKSLINQTYKNIEIIVVNDGSTDETGNLLEKIALEYSNIRVINQSNQGVSKARNVGILASEGKYITFLDSDDYHKNEYIEKMHSGIIKNNYDVACCGYYNRKNGISKKKITRFKERDILLNYIIGNNAFITSSWLLKKSYLINNKIFFDESMSWGEDYKFFCQVLSRTSSIILIKEYLTVYNHDVTGDRLSSFMLDKVDKDFYLINSLLNDTIINKDEKVKDSLIRYRLPALITYRLNLALKFDENYDEVYEYYKEYESYINNYSMKYGLRSFKLAYNTFILKKKLKKYYVN